MQKRLSLNIFRKTLGGENGANLQQQLFVEKFIIFFLPQFLLVISYQYRQYTGCPENTMFDQRFFGSEFLAGIV